jgi:hypothetical protein
MVRMERMKNREDLDSVIGRFDSVRNLKNKMETLTNPTIGV